MSKIAQKPTPHTAAKSPSSGDAPSGIPSGPAPTLSSAQLKALRRCRMILIKDLDPDDLPACLSGDDLTAKSSNPPDPGSSHRGGREERAALILDRLETSDERTFQTFMDSIKDRYRHVHSVLVETLQAVNRNDSQEDERLRERASLSGDAIRQLLSERDRRRAEARSSGDSNYVNDGEEEGSERAEENREGYLNCYVVTKSGRLERDKWIKHSGFGRYSSDAEDVQPEVNYMGVIRKDTAFKLVDRSALPEKIQLRLPQNCFRIYSVDKGCPQTSRNCESDLKCSDSRSSKMQDFGKYRRKNNTGMESPVIQAVPPPLPPKPDNFPCSVSKAGYNNSTSTEDRLTNNNDDCLANAEKEIESVHAPVTSLDDGLSEAGAKSPPLPVRQPRDPYYRKPDPPQVPSLETKHPLPQLPDIAESFTETTAVQALPENTALQALTENTAVQALPGNTAVQALPEGAAVPVTSHAESVMPNDETEKDKESEEEDNDDDDDISLNYNVQVEDDLSEFTSEEVDRASIVGDTITTTATIEAKFDESSHVNIPNSLEIPADHTDAVKSGVSNISIGSPGPIEGRVSPESVTGKVNACDSGVDSVVSLGGCDSPNDADILDHNIFLSASLGNLEILPGTASVDAAAMSAANQISSAASYSFYEDIELVEGFRSSAAYLDPHSSQTLSARSLTDRHGYHRPQPQPQSVKTPPGERCRKILKKGSLMVIDTVKTAALSDNDCKGEASGSSDSETLLFGYDKDSMPFLLSSSLIKNHGDPEEEQWFYPIEITPKEASLFLLSENQKGCFIVYRPAHCRRIAYILSVCRGDRLVVHYHIVQNIHGDVMIENHDHSFMSLAELVDYFRKNPSRLATRLRRPLKDARLPIRPGYHFPQQFALQRNSFLLSGKIIGEGRFGIICQGLYKGATVSVKVLQKDATIVDDDDFLEEALVMMNLQHENIIELIGVCCSNRPFYILTEFFEKGTLKRCLESETISTDNIDVLFDICIQMVSAFVYLESLQYVLHRDICARNFLLTDDTLIKLANFERARQVIDDNYQADPTEEIIIKWAAPEVISQSCYSTKSDVWSLGVVFWEVFSRGADPFGDLRDEKVTSFVLEGGRLDKPPGCSHDIYSMMQSCWHESPDQRPSFETLSEKIKGKSSIYYVSPLLRKKPADFPERKVLSTPGAAPQARTMLPLPGRSIKSPTIPGHARASSSSALNSFRLSTPLLGPRTSHAVSRGVDGGTGTTKTRLTMSSSVCERVPASSSDSSSIVSSSVLNERDSEELTRSDRIRKSLRKLIKKKTPSFSSAQYNVKHT